jgi:ubiquinone/menaquinone biosynthesis C-methylase UbiE
MIKPRVIETNEGIQNPVTVQDYDIFLRHMRDQGLLKIDAILDAGITTGPVLEIGPGPGYLGLEWLTKTTNTFLTGIEISSNMIDLATKNAREYGLTDRAAYQLGNAQEMPFADHSFVAVFSNGSLHEWEHPEKIFREIHRVLQPGGRVLISDLKRDLALPIKLLFYLGVKPKRMRHGLTTSLKAAYTASELTGLLQNSDLQYAQVSSNPFGLQFFGIKPA